MRLIILVLMFLMIGALFIVSENNLALKENKSRQELKTIYLSWFEQLFNNSKNLIGYVVKLEWLPENQNES
ncbi:MAG: hypothetical protein KJ559_01220 [Nanoarchaeota archaeon]|nr:hypothetical protein [Nanoarchaeota archaeon]